MIFILKNFIAKLKKIKKLPKYMNKYIKTSVRLVLLLSMYIFTSLHCNVIFMTQVMSFIIILRKGAKAH